MVHTGLSRQIISKIIFAACLVACLTPFVDTAWALLLGIIIAQTTGHPWISYNPMITRRMLQYSVIGLGFGMNWVEAMKAGQEGFVFTICSISGTFIAGWLLSKILKIESKTSYLISSGTAICGGSAIAAVSPVMQAGEKQMSVALGSVFILNSIALFLFPYFGHLLHFSAHQFGVWAAIAIHDTSSVVGASSRYVIDASKPLEALQIATTIKLERALWIIPLVFVTSFIFRNKSHKIRIPWFILFFVLAMLVNSYLPQIHDISKWIVLIAKKGLTVTLFLIGTGLSRHVLKSVGIRPLLEAVILWILISVSSLIVIHFTVS